MKAIYVAKPRDLTGPVRLARRPIAEIMSTPVVTIGTEALLNDALAAMITNRIRHLAVIGDDGRCLGVLSDRAIAAAWAGDYTALAHRRVAGCLDAEPATVSVSAAVVDAARMMRAHAVDAIAVTNPAGYPVGIVTGSDLVSLLAG